VTYRPFTDILSAASSSSARSLLINNSGIDLPGLVPVRLDNAGQLDVIDVSTDAGTLSIVGITEQSIVDSTAGYITTSGKLINISTSFDFGDFVYVSKIGDLTNSIPTVGINGFTNGDFIIRIGTIAQNDTNPLQKDIFIDITVIGQL
jgi:hypothetical protein